MSRKKTERLTINKLHDDGVLNLVSELLYGMNENLEDIEKIGNEKEISRAREELKSEYWQTFSMGLSAIRLEEFNNKIIKRRIGAVS